MQLEITMSGNFEEEGTVLKDSERLQRKGGQVRKS